MSLDVEAIRREMDRVDGEVEATPIEPTSPDGAESGMSDALVTAGRADAPGVLFVAGTARLRRPESRPALSAIGDMLTEQPELQLRVVGRVEGGQATVAGRALATQRAAAVRTYLIDEFGVAADRLTTGTTTGAGAAILLVRQTP